MPYVVVYNRDPKIVWYEDKADPADSHWVVVLLLDGPNSSIWTSKDMIHWERSQTLDNIDVCPDCADFYEIALDGDPNNKKWILWFGDGDYNVGTFDGKTFNKEAGPIKSKTERTPGDRDRNDHIAQTFTGIPAADGRRIQMGWVLSDPKKGSQFPGMPFCGQYTLPRVLTLRTTPDGPRLFFEPAKETEKLRTGVSAQMPRTTSGRNRHAPERKEAARRTRRGERGLYRSIRTSWRSLEIISSVWISTDRLLPATWTMSR